MASPRGSEAMSAGRGLRTAVLAAPTAPREQAAGRGQAARAARVRSVPTTAPGPTAPVAVAVASREPRAHRAPVCPSPAAGSAVGAAAPPAGVVRGRADTATAAPS